MKKYLAKVPAQVKKLIARARRISLERNIPMYLVGGFVRDLLLGVKNFDLDIVVEGDAIECARDFAKGIPCRIITHSRFGTACLHLQGSSKVDFAMARREVYPQGGCLPVVSASDIHNDLARRDFTINAMAISIGPHNYAELLDFLGGRHDLRKGKLRILHPLSFIDDPTRILRGIRFKERYNFSWEKNTLLSLREAVSRRRLDRVQPQRVRDELILLLQEDDPLPALKTLQKLVGLSFIDKSLKAGTDMLRLCAKIARQIRWYELRYASRRPLDKWLVYLMGICDCLSRKRVEVFCARYMFLKEEQKKLGDYKSVTPALAASLSKKGIPPARVQALLKALSYEAILVLKAKYPHPVLQKHVRNYFEHYNEVRIEIGGKDLLGLGVDPGPRYRKILQAVLEARLNGEVTSRAQELRLAKSLLGLR